MIDYSKWKELQLSPVNLRLDPKNPRIPHSGEDLSQPDLIADLVENEKVYDLAKSIADNGYYPIEALILVEENKEKLVLEGNRRLAALKLLISPEAAPEKWVPRFRALANRIDAKGLRKVKVVRAPTRESAAPIIMSRHTRNQVESWSPLMQAKFYSNLVERGMKIDEIAEQHKIPPSEITDALQRDTMYSVACALELPEEIIKKVHNPREFPMTNLDRLYKNPKVNEFLGISFDKSKRLIGSIDVNEFKKGYGKIVTDIATGEVHSRSLNTTKEMDGYLNSFGKQQPDKKKKGKFTAESILNLRPRGGVGPTKPKRKAKTTPTSQALIPKAYWSNVSNQRIIDVFNELKTLRVDRYENAVALMFRSLLEMSLGYYLDRTGHVAKITETERAKRARKTQNLPDDWHPTLSQMLQYVVNQEPAIITNGNLLKAVRKLLSEKDELLSVDTLNLFVHNQHFQPTEATLRRFWNQLRGLFDIILVEPKENSPAGDGSQ
jgi:hypothetical protein